MKDNKTGLPYLFKWIRVNVKLFVRFINRVVQFLFVDLFRLDFTQLKSWQRRLAKDLQIIVLMLRKYSAQKIGPQSSSLSYQMTMSVVPFMAILFFVASGFGLQDKVMEVLQANVSDQRMLGLLTNAAKTIVTTARSGLFGFISIASFLWIVLWLMMRVQLVFTDIWRRDEMTDEILSLRTPRKAEDRPVQEEEPVGGKRRKKRQDVGNVWNLRRILVMFGILFLSPFVLILFFSGSFLYSNILNFLIPDFELADTIRSFLGWVMFGAVSICIIAVMYKYFPAAKVHFRYAFKAAVFAGIAFTALQYLYLETQVMVTKLNKFYGVIAALPLFMVWLNLGWMFILYGASLSYAMQNLAGTRSEDIKDVIMGTTPMHGKISDVVSDVEQVRNRNDRYRSAMRGDEHSYDVK